MANSDSAPSPPGTQTLMRGLDILELVAQSRDGITVQQAADHVGIHRTMAMRSLSALSGRNLVRKAPDGKFWIGAGIVALAREYQPALRDAARPVLERLASELQSVACLFVAENESSVAFLVIEPENVPILLTFKTGSRHPANLGSASYAIASLRPPSKNEPSAVADARRDGYARSHGQIQTGGWGVSVPLDPALSGIEACVHITTFEEAIADKSVPLLVAAARELEQSLSG